MNLAGKTAIVTGGGSGIGEAIVRLFASQGAAVVIADWNEKEAARLADILTSSGLQAATVKVDVSKDADVQSLIQETVQRFGQVDILVNNAAVILPKFLEDVEEAEWDRLFNINLKSVYLTVKHALPYLRKTRGSIVNMASLNGLVGQKMNPVYAATKGGVVAMTKALALDYAPDGIRVNCICPAGVSTPLLQQWIGEQDDPAATVQILNDMHPIGRPATSEEIAQAALFLASAQSGFVTGVALPVDGGASLGY
ncbi:MULTISPECIES: SDR family NAD(P)-dependent oxidoreductase [unclassified Paenibacillus]|uniref:SDR family NAD(P)-dependent oxidoreductase n=1 Tax=unclassified Paenibacillus TaxID=185978 RepID=UPI00070E7DAE|nr:MULTISPECIES: glucose 1-dehydrogenase [unclassified Paenibacillus]KQX46891.1 short-chain dehydrogenase [Paenibacillus sp. Root444D2]KRE48491.1 short-chain dehydrogenase [Paenibacillus sp. Soil724D2]